MHTDRLKSLLSVFLTLQVTKELPRQGFINFGFKRNDSDSVAAHSFTVAAFAYFIAKQLKQDGLEIDPDHVLRVALIHDMGEAISGDIGYHVKRIAGDALDKVELQTFSMLIDPLSFADEIKALYTEYNASNSVESKVVKLADALDALTQMLLTPGADLRSAKTFMHEKAEGLHCPPPVGDRLVRLFESACELLKNKEVSIIG